MYDTNLKYPIFQPESFEFTGEASFLAELESPFSAAEEMELAAELLAVTNDAELEQFLGNLFKKAWRGIKTFGSKIIRPLGGVLKIVAKKALPFLATAAGTFFGGPAGGAIAGKLGSLVSQALESETAGVAPADRDLEKCRQFVRMAGTAAKAAAAAAPGSDPIALAKKVLTRSAQQKISKSTPVRAVVRAVPGFQPGAATRKAMIGRAQPKGGTASTAFVGTRCTCGNPANCTCGKTGRWFRRGSSIVLINC